MPSLLVSVWIRSFADRNSQYGIPLWLTSGGAVANRIGRFNTLTGASIICAILIFWLNVTSQSGFFSGTVNGLFSVTIAMTATKPNEVGSYMGMALGVLSISTLTEMPISGL